ncbi:hypothetical protein RYX36_007267, partial [Vicia faba]
MIYGIRRTRSFSLAVVMPVSTLQNHLDGYVLIVTSGGLNQQRTGASGDSYRHDLWNSANSQLFAGCSNAGINFAKSSGWVCVNCNQWRLKSTKNGGKLSFFLNQLWYWLVEIVTGMIYGIQRTRSFSLAVVMPVSTLQNHLDRYVLIVTSGGLNQQRTGIIDVVVAAYILNAILVVPELDLLLFRSWISCCSGVGSCIFLERQRVCLYTYFPLLLLATTHQQLNHDAANEEAYNPEKLASEVITSSKSGTRVGFIGLGAMGFGMATHLVKSNFSVFGYDDGGVKGKASGQPNYGGGAFY